MRSHLCALTLVATAVVLSSTAQPAAAQQVTAPVEAPAVQQHLQPNNVDDIRNSQVLGIPTSFCGHVIELLNNNRLRRQTGLIGEGEIFLPHLTAGLKPGDLELMCVHLVCDGDAVKGPVFQISMKNSSCVPIGNFKVSIVGVLCQIDVHSPTATICIPRMEPGEVRQIQIQLPLTCMCMGPATQPVPFDTLVVALDSYDELLECDELNNVQILKRAEIGLLVAEAPAPAPAPAPATVEPEQTVPAQPVTPDTRPEDELDLDNLDLSSAQSLQVPGS